MRCMFQTLQHMYSDGDINIVMYNNMYVVIKKNHLI